ncbi:ROK family transcriptional regulator [Agromyces intestinalis]|nr:ROK family transcriptional regulator [Agromyces intestinalis]
MNDHHPGSGGDDVRRRNLSAVLAQVHTRREVARSQITRATGLSRSSVATQVGELIAAGLLRESAAGESTGVGRPSPVVSPTGRFLAVAVNPDVDGVSVALCALGGQIVAQTKRASSSLMNPAEAARLAAEALEELTADRPDAVLLSVTAAIPGRIDIARDRVAVAPHLQWHDVPFSAMLEAATGLPTTSHPDATIGLEAERLWGAAEGLDDAVYFYGGPGGIGGAAMVGGQVLAGRVGAAARLGHLIVAPDGPLCVCGSVGCLTTMVSFHQLAAAFGVTSGSLDDLKAAIETETSTTLRGFLDRELEYVGRALRTAISTYDPALILLGGFFAVLFEVGGEQLLGSIAPDNLSSLRSPAVLGTPALGVDQLLIGAGAKGFEPLLHDPLGYAQRRASA